MINRQMMNPQKNFSLGKLFEAALVTALTVVTFAVTALTVRAQTPVQPLRGFNLSEYGGATNLFDAAKLPAGVSYGDPSYEKIKTPAQRIVDELYGMGVRHINLNSFGSMQGTPGKECRGNAVLLPFRGAERQKAVERFTRLARYIVEGKGMTVGFRPYFLVKKSSASEASKKCWHGNIIPSDPTAWFLSYRSFLKFYSDLAVNLKTVTADPDKVVSEDGRTLTPVNVSQFTVAAELYSMTVGLEDIASYEHAKGLSPEEIKVFQFGFPKEWSEIVKTVKSQLGSQTTVMYDVNYTDAVTPVGNGDQEIGGELARWRYRMTQQPPDANLMGFYESLDAIGVDMYSALSNNKDDAPLSLTFDELVDVLNIKAGEWGEDLDRKFIAMHDAYRRYRSLPSSTKIKPVIFKEVGYKSIDYGFMDSFGYAGDDPNHVVNPNPMHQAAAYKSWFVNIWEPGYSWFAGVTWWDVAIDLNARGEGDKGFSPIGKDKTEEVISSYFRD